MELKSFFCFCHAATSSHHQCNCNTITEGIGVKHESIGVKHESIGVKHESIGVKHEGIGVTGKS